MAFLGNPSLGENIFKIEPTIRHVEGGYESADFDEAVKALEDNAEHNAHDTLERLRWNGWELVKTHRHPSRKL